MLQKLWFKVLLGMFLGVSLGLILSPSAFALVPQSVAIAIVPWVALVGNIFLALIKMVVIPLVMSSIILGIISSEDTKTLKSLGLKIAPYFVFTTIIAVSIGILISYYVKPGDFVSKDLVETISTATVAVQEVGTFNSISLPDMIVNLIPVNTAKANLDGNILAFVILAIFVGIALMNMKEEEESLLCVVMKSLPGLLNRGPAPRRSVAIEQIEIGVPAIGNRRA